MSNKLTKNVSMSEADMLDFEKKLPLLKDHLSLITNALMELAKLTDATEDEKNELLRNCYNKVGERMLSFDEWRERGCVVRRYEHGYLFWNNGDIVVLYCREQVKQIQLTLFTF